MLSDELVVRAQVFALPLWQGLVTLRGQIAANSDGSAPDGDNNHVPRDFDTTLFRDDFEPTSNTPNP